MEIWDRLKTAADALAGKLSGDAQAIATARTAQKKAEDDLAAATAGNAQIEAQVARLEALAAQP